MSSKKKTSTSRKELIAEDREKQWYVPPSSGIPTYKAESDPNCPVGRIGNYNRRQKQKIQSIPDTHKTADWIKQKLDRKYEDMPLKVHVNLSKKAMDEAKGTYDTTVTRPSPAEVEILQKIIVRERLLSELTRLVRSGSDIMSIMGEVVELIKAIRYETVDIVEDISNWQAFQPTPRPFLYKGMNYLIKISCDFDFLDNYDEVVERFCFEFKSNPFAYKGGGNVITGAGPKNNERYLHGLLNSYYEGGNINVDGIEVVRLHNAEKIIQGEFNRLAEQGNINLGTTHDKIPDALHLMNSSLDINAGTGEATTGESALQHSMSSPGFQNSNGNNNSSGQKARPNSSSGARKGVFNQKKIKLERIATLQSEVDELMAVMAHITEKIQTITIDYQDRVKHYRAIEKKMLEAKNAGKEAATQHCAAELVIRKAGLVELTNKVKELQREHYFVGLEKKRKQGVIKTLQHEMDEEKRKAALKKKIEEVIKTKGLSAALDLINTQKPSVQASTNTATGTATKTRTLSASSTGSSGKKKRKKSKRSKKLKKEQLNYNSSDHANNSGSGRYDHQEEEDEEDGDEEGDEEEDEENENNDYNENNNDPFGFVDNSNMQFGETFSSQQMQQMQGLNVERIDEGEDEGEEEEGEEEEEEDGEGDDGEEGEEEEEEEEEGEEEGDMQEEEGEQQGNKDDSIRVSIQSHAAVTQNNPYTDSPANNEEIIQTHQNTHQSNQPKQQQPKKAKQPPPLSHDEQLARQHEEEKRYMRQLQEELSSSSLSNTNHIAHEATDTTDKTLSHNTSSHHSPRAVLPPLSPLNDHQGTPLSARSNNITPTNQSRQLSSHRVGYISDEEGEEEEDDDLEVSADMSTAPAGSGFQVAKALKLSPRPVNS